MRRILLFVTVALLMIPALPAQGGIWNAGTFERKVRIEVHVTDAITGEAIKDAEIVCKIKEKPFPRRKIGFVDDNGDGAVEFKVVKEKDVKLIVFSPFHSVAKKIIHVEKGETYHLDVSLYSVPDTEEFIRSIPVANVTGYVKNLFTGKPVKWIIVEACTAECEVEFNDYVKFCLPICPGTKADENGRFTLPIFCTGSVDVDSEGNPIFNYSRPTKVRISTSTGLGVVNLEVYPNNTYHVNITYIPLPTDPLWMLYSLFIR